MKVVVEAGALTPLCDDGEPRPGHEAHEQQDVDMTCLPAGREGGIRAGLGGVGEGDWTATVTHF